MAKISISPISSDSHLLLLIEEQLISAQIGATYIFYEVSECSCEKLLNVKNKRTKQNENSMISEMIMAQSSEIFFTCFDKVYGEGIFEKVKLHAEYTQI